MGGQGSGRKPREYPAALVEQVRHLYESGMTIAEIQSSVSGIKVQNVMQRYGIARRPATERDQRGERNSSWRGDRAGCQALHLRVETVRGKPRECARCGATSGRMEWANLTGDYANTDDYQRMCVGCHRRYDAERRRATGTRTSPGRRKPC